MTENSADSPAGKAVLSPEALDAFEDIWREWAYEGDNRELMEAGGLPELRPLAERVILWACRLPLVDETR